MKDIFHVMKIDTSKRGSEWRKGGPTISCIKEFKVPLVTTSKGNIAIMTTETLKIIHIEEKLSITGNIGNLTGTTTSRELNIAKSFNSLLTI